MQLHSRQHKVQEYYSTVQKKKSQKWTDNDLVFGDSVPVKQQELKADGVKSLHTSRKVKHKGLVEHWVECSLFHVGFFLGQPLTIIQQVDLHIRICKAGRKDAEFCSTEFSLV